MTSEAKNNISSLLTIEVLKIFKDWSLTDNEKLTLLNLNNIKARNLSQYQMGDKYFEFNEDLSLRVKTILGINEAISTSYPTNQNYATIWLRRKQKKFKNNTPLSMMLKSNASMKAVWHFLDCTKSWED